MGNYRKFVMIVLLCIVNAGLLAAVELPEADGNTMMPDSRVLPKKETLRVVKGLSAKVEGDVTAITVEMDQKISEDDLSLENHETFIQMLLPRTIVEQPGKFIEVQTPYVNKLVGFQSKADAASLRFFVGEDALNIKKSSSISTHDNRIVLRIDHKKLEELIRTDPSLTAKTKKSPSAQEVVEKTKISTEIPEPAAKIGAVENKIEPVQAVEAEHQEAIDLKMLTGDSGKKMYDRLFKAGIFCAVMLLGLLGFYVWRPRFKRFRDIPDDYGAVQMKTLAKHAISPKQRLELIDVGGEKILIAISPDQVQFLTNIQQHRPEPQLAVHSKPQVTLNPVTQQVANRVPQINQSVEQPKLSGTMRAAATSAKPAATPTSSPTPTRRRIETRVGGDIKMDYKSVPPVKRNQDNQTISDVTRLIREKLKNLPTV